MDGKNAPLDRISESKIQNGSRVVAQDGTAYRVSHLLFGHGMTLTREMPKVRGKAARRADKRRRLAALRETAHV